MLPERIRDFNGQTSGTVDISGLAEQRSQGEVNLAAAQGTIAGQAFDNLNVKAVFSGTTDRAGTGGDADRQREADSATGNYDREIYGVSFGSSRVRADSAAA